MLKTIGHLKFQPHHYRTHFSSADAAREIASSASDWYAQYKAVDSGGNGYWDQTAAAASSNNHNQNHNVYQNHHVQATEESLRNDLIDRCD